MTEPTDPADSPSADDSLSASADAVPVTGHDRPRAWPRRVRDFVPAGGWGFHVFSQRDVPVLVSVAYWATLVAAVLGLVLSLVRMAQRLIDGSGGDVLGTASLVLFAVICLLQLLLAFKIREGLDWARILLALLALPGLLVGGAVLTLAGSPGGLAGCVGIIAVCFLWVQEPDSWFRFHRENPS